MKSLNRYIDHTLLKANATKQEIINLCEEAKTHNFFSVCVNSAYVALAKAQLKDSNVKVCSVIGFPLGAASTSAKVAEAKTAVEDGADEIDMVMNIGLLKSKDFDAVWKDIEAVKNQLPNTILKVILETCYLDDLEIIKASELAVHSGADFIKTSTGFGKRGASIHDVKLMKSVCKDCVKIKASGSIKDAKTALEYINLGVERLGTSSGIAIVSGKTSNSTY
ncbi:deoxyribose-phosphate aldolase [Jejuia pallidilutea]|uniref:Deoxyribose-phosphate aldolase n=1 Tax=Jejuia pallidilutea TaxID=504487 RepID=A0A090W9B2_9FLAO|nr:deoxyribose-phosphate aldolase [Jejuia pallidilutea]GAL68557.1 deoxyribose-phosphate aldolase [Jejuia pallidilutea]GAL72049.1 deoxyribose-phosphate aldolase [Jejuia pallidilutea]GAL88429.1 deoxyribose-phosphate aldolase [Jejuia pallidilutea]